MTFVDKIDEELFLKAASLKAGYPISYADSLVTAILSEKTVKTHLQNIYRKRDARGRVEALKKARDLGFNPHI